MRTKYLYILFATLFVCCEITTRGQEAFDPIRATVDSLDRVQPVPLKDVKPIGHAYIIKVKTQADFDALNDNITKAIREGKTNIKVKIGCGTYWFHENHILRRNENTLNVSIAIEGNKRTVLTSDKGNSRELFTIQNPWRDMDYAEGQIEVVGEANKLCKIPFRNHYRWVLFIPYFHVHPKQNP